MKKEVLISVIFIVVFTTCYILDHKFVIIGYIIGSIITYLKK